MSGRTSLPHVCAVIASGLAKPHYFLGVLTKSRVLQMGLNALELFRRQGIAGLK
jgi:hypothetical protein